MGHFNNPGIRLKTRGKCQYFSKFKFISMGRVETEYFGTIYLIKNKTQPELGLKSLVL